MDKKDVDRLIQSFKVIEGICVPYLATEESRRVNEVIELINHTAKDQREWLEAYMPDDNYFIPGQINGG
jgi:hypothetical protein